MKEIMEGRMGKNGLRTVMIDDDVCGGQQLLMSERKSTVLNIV